MALVTLAQAKQQLRTDTDVDDAEISEICDRATSILLDYIEAEADAYQQTEGSPTDEVPGVLVAACLILVQNLFDGLDPVLSESVKDLLRRFRTPAVS
jgi:hypothetical protein